MHSSGDLINFLTWRKMMTNLVCGIRTRQPFFKSRTGMYLLVATLLIALATILIPLTPLAEPFGFTRMPLLFFPVLGGIIVAYIVGAEVVKHIFYRWVHL
jgi:P-type Mg2+ transporter